MVGELTDGQLFSITVVITGISREQSVTSLQGAPALGHCVVTFNRYVCHGNAMLQDSVTATTGAISKNKKLKLYYCINLSFSIM